MEYGNLIIRIFVGILVVAIIIAVALLVLSSFSSQVNAECCSSQLNGTLVHYDLTSSGIISNQQADYCALHNGTLIPIQDVYCWVNTTMVIG